MRKRHSQLVNRGTVISLSLVSMYARNVTIMLLRDVSVCTPHVICDSEMFCNNSTHFQPCGWTPKRVVLRTLYVFWWLFLIWQMQWSQHQERTLSRTSIAAKLLTIFSTFISITCSRISGGRFMAILVQNQDITDTTFEYWDYFRTIFVWTKQQQ